VSPTLNVNLTLFVIPCDFFGIIDLRYCNYCHLSSDCSSKFQSSMTWLHYKIVRRHNISNFNYSNNWLGFHPSFNHPREQRWLGHAIDQTFVSITGIYFIQFQSSMTRFHYKKLRVQNTTNFVSVVGMNFNQIFNYPWQYLQPYS
jgi:hypothetical protein